VVDFNALKLIVYDKLIIMLVSALDYSCQYYSFAER
jgi:hypothetical protein